MYIHTHVRIWPLNYLYCTTGRRIDSADVVCALKKLNAEYLQCYICGPPSLISFITGVLTTEGIDEERIHFEKWW